MKVALTGGIACGKSLLSNFLRELGVETIDADDVVHTLLPDPEERRRIAAEVFADPEKRRALEAKIHPLVKERIDQWLGEVLAPSAGARASLVPALRWCLVPGACCLPAPCTSAALPRESTSISPERSEPRKRSLEGCEAAKARAEGASTSAAGAQAPTIRIAVIPLLFEAHWEKNFDIICCVVSSREKQIERMMTTRGMTLAEAEARLAAQLPVEEKAKRSHYVIHNDGKPEELKAEATAFLGWLKSKEPLKTLA